MSRKLPIGTPTRTTDYVFPARRQSLLFGSLAAGVSLFVLLIGVWWAGGSSALSPGPIAAPHASLGAECVLCHAVGDRVEDQRCERCHDSTSTQRLTNQAHVFFGSRDARKASEAARVECVRCHVDHRGVDVLLSAADDRECGTCHVFTTLGAHPEFAAVTANTQTGLGLRFTHDKHIVRVEEATGGKCEACHVQTADLRDHEPISYDRHCAGCHTSLLAAAKSGRVPESVLTLVEDVPDEYKQAGIEVVDRSGRPGRYTIEIVGMVHRDPWVRYNLTKLRREIDPQPERAERAGLQSQLDWLRQQQRGQPLRALTVSRLVPVVAELEAQVERLESQLAGAERAGATRDVLQAIGDTAFGIANRLAEADFQQRGNDPQFGAAVESARQLPESLGRLVGDIATAPGPLNREPDEDEDARFERRRGELGELLDAIEARGGEAFADRVVDLRGELEDVMREGSSSAEDLPALEALLRNLDNALRVIARLNDPNARIAGAQIDLLREIANQRVGGGLSPQEFAARRSEVLSLLDTIENRGTVTVRLRVAGLRQRATRLRVGDAGTDDLERQLVSSRRLLARVQLEIELEEYGAIGGEGSDSSRDRPLALGSQRDLAAINVAIRSVEARLAELSSGPRGPVATDDRDRKARYDAIDKLALSCSKCHVIVPGSGLAAVRVAEPVLPLSLFNHAPHVTLVTCDACHGQRDAQDQLAQRIYASGTAEDVNVPGVQECAVCHRPGQRSGECETCHVYHPRSITEYLGLR